MKKLLLFTIVVWSILVRSAFAQDEAGPYITVYIGTAPGCAYTSASGAPSGGNVCDHYVDTSTGDLYTKTSGGWRKYGTVFSVALSLPSFITVSGSPITGTGTLTGTLATQVKNKFFVGPITGSDAAPTFRVMNDADLSFGVPVRGDVLIGNSTPAWARLAVGAFGQILRSSGTDLAWSTPTYPNTAGSGKVLIGDGTNIVLSTPTYPNAGPTAGTFIRGDGTNEVQSTLVLPNAATTGDLHYASTTNTIGNLAAVAIGQVLASAGTATAPAYTTTPKLTAVYGQPSDKVLKLGGSGGSCTAYPACESVEATVNGGVLRLQAATASKYTLRLSVDNEGSHLDSTYAGSWRPLRFDGAPTTIGGGGFHVGTNAISDPGLGNAALDGFIGTSNYASQTTGWRIDHDGSADFRYLYTDELHAKSFIADLEQALAGGQIISKSVAKVGAIFTAPAPGSISTLTVQDLPSATSMAVFESGDAIRIRQFSRASGSLSITDAWGVVTGHIDIGSCGITGSTATCQTWQFTRNVTNGGAMTTGAQIAIDAIVLDYGVSGNGFYEVNAIDGLYAVNSPYMQIVTWAGNSPIAANQTVRTRCGNLKGITGVLEFGCLLGTYTGAASDKYLVLSDQQAAIHNLSLDIYSGANRAIILDPATPYFSMGTTAPTSYSSGVGMWTGIEAGCYKWRVGNLSGNYASFDSCSGIFNVNGNISVTGFIANDTNHVNGVASATVASGAAIAAALFNSNGALLTPASPSGTGLFLGSTYMGYYTSGAYRTFIDSSGNLQLGDTAGSAAGLTWNQAGASLTIRGSIVITGGSGYANIADKPTSLSGINGTEGTKLTGIEAGATVTSTHTAADTALVDGYSAALAHNGADKANGALDATYYLKTRVIPSSTVGSNCTGGTSSFFVGSDYLGFCKSGVWATYMDSSANFYLGGSGGALQFNGATGELAITGQVTAATGAIGGFNIGSDYLRDTVNSMGMSSTVTGGDDVRFWAGDTFANRATAPIHIFESGKLVSGSVSLTSVSGITIDPNVSSGSPIIGKGYQFVGSTGTDFFGLYAFDISSVESELLLTNSRASSSTQADIAIVTSAVAGTSTILVEPTHIEMSTSYSGPNAIILNNSTQIVGVLGVTDDFAINTNKFNVTASTGDTVLSGTLTTASYTSRAGVGGATSNQFNINWNNPCAEIWIDTSNLGCIAIASDARVKTPLVSLTTGLAEVNQLRPGSFTFLTMNTGTMHLPTSGEVHYGLLAQDVQKIIPDLVRNTGMITDLTPDGMLQVKYEEMIPVLVKAIQDLSHEVDQLKAKVH